MRKFMTLVSVFGITIFPLNNLAVATEMSALPQPTYKVGYQHIGIKDGDDLTTTLVDKIDTTYTLENSRGCKWTSLNTGFAPSSEWSGCGGNDGSAIVTLVNGSLYPLKIGNSWKYDIDGGNWSNWRSCEVASMETITVPAGTHNAFKVVCETKRDTRTYWISTKLNRFARLKRTSSRGYTGELKEIVSVGQ